MKKVIQEGVSVDKKSVDIPYLTPLMAAADSGFTAIVNFLLDNNANVNAKDELGVTALVYAARKGNVDIVKLLLSRGALANIITKQGNTILNEILRVYGDNLPNSTNKESRSQFKKNILVILELLLEKGADINKQGNPSGSARTPIMWAALWKDLNLVKFFKDKGADIYLRDQFGNDLSFYLPDPSKDKDLTPADIEFIKNLKNEILESDWTEIKNK